MNSVATKPLTQHQRDPRIDVFRGAALVMIFADHIPDDVLNRVTLHNFGFSDAAEVFVLLAGVSAMLAYGRAFEREGAAGGLRRVALRCGKIYLFQAALLVTTFLVVRSWTSHYHLQSAILGPMLGHPVAGLARGLALGALPSYLDILPLYVVLLGCFPLIYLAIRRNVWLAAAASASIWLLAALDHRIDLPNWLDTNGWYFDPFSWQFLFTIGCLLSLALKRGGGALPRWRWLAALCWAYLAFAFMQGASWHDWSMPDLRPIDMAFPRQVAPEPVAPAGRDGAVLPAAEFPARAGRGRLALAPPARPLRPPFAGGVFTELRHRPVRPPVLPHLWRGRGDGGAGERRRARLHVSDRALARAGQAGGAADLGIKGRARAQRCLTRDSLTRHGLTWRGSGDARLDPCCAGWAMELPAELRGRRRAAAPKPQPHRLHQRVSVQRNIGPVFAGNAGALRKLHDKLARRWPVARNDEPGALVKTPRRHIVRRHQQPNPPAPGNPAQPAQRRQNRRAPKPKALMPRIDRQPTEPPAGPIPPVRMHDEKSGKPPLVEDADQPMRRAAPHEAKNIRQRLEEPLAMVQLQRRKPAELGRCDRLEDGSSTREGWHESLAIKGDKTPMRTRGEPAATRSVSRRPGAKPGTYHPSCVKNGTDRIKIQCCITV